MTTRPSMSVSRMSALAMPRRPASRSSSRQLHRLNRPAGSPSPRRRDEPHARAARLCRRAPPRRVRPDAVRSTSCGVIAPAQQHVRERRRLRRRIPAVDVERRVRFGDALRLHPRQRGVELSPSSSARQDVVRRAVHDAAESVDAHGGQRLAHQVEDRDAVHHRAFEQERRPRSRGERAQLLDRRTRPAPCLR